MDKVFLRIIIPCYNVASTLPRCLDSILSQTFQDFIVILVDDQSTDGTQQVIQDYVRKNNRVRTVETNEKKFACGCRNVGLTYPLITDYTWFMDGDDQLENDSIFEKVHHVLMKNPVDILFVGYRVVEPDGEFQDIVPDYDGISMAMYNYHCAPWTKVIKSGKVVPFKERMRYREDVLQHILQVDCIETFSCLNCICYVYRKVKKKSFSDKAARMVEYATNLLECLFLNKIKRPEGIETVQRKAMRVMTCLQELESK